jgi:hypothetical protein
MFLALFLKNKNISFALLDIFYPSCGFKGK